MWREDPASVRPMLAATTTAPLNSPELAYERKYDGIRAIAAIDPAAPSVRFWSRLGNDKTAQFPDIAERLRALGVLLNRPVVLDGEIVALDTHGQPMSFQHLQGRMHLVDPLRSRAKGAAKPRGDISSGTSEPNPVADVPTAFIAFDLLRDGDEDLRTLPLRERRRRLETLLAGVNDPGLRLSEFAVGDGRTLHERAQREGWEGLIVKRLDSAYTSGRRSPDWRKLKFERRQTCVIGGWTEPRGSRGVLWFADPRRVRRRWSAEARRTQRLGLHRCGTGTCLEAAGSARDEDLPVFIGAAHERATALGTTEAPRRSEVHGVDHGRAAAASDLHRVSATTRRRSGPARARHRHTQVASILAEHTSNDDTHIQVHGETQHPSPR